MIAEVQQIIVKSLRQREWEMMITDADASGGFICSDSPLVWGALDAIKNGALDASLDAPGVEVTFPVNKNIALVSRQSARRSNCTATSEIVAHINMRTLQLGMGLVFHSGPEFLLRRRGGDIRQASEYFAYVEEARRHGILRP